MGTKPKFSLDDFKFWMKEHHKLDYVLERPTNPLVGVSVEPKLSVKKTTSKVTVESGEIEDVVNDFHNEGGKIAEVNGMDFLVEVKSGTFYINRLHVRRG